MDRVNPDHLKLLVERLERGETVEFKSGTKIRAERRYVVETPIAGIYVFGEREIERAFRLAAREEWGPVPPDMRSDPELDKRWGAEAPF